MNKKQQEIEKLKKEAEATGFYNNAAFRLYELGEQEFALNILLNQFRKYKELPNPRHSGAGNIFRILLLQIASTRDKHAAEDFFQVLGLFTLEAARGLAKIDGEEVEDRLLSLKTTENMEGIGALIALAYLKHPDARNYLIDLVSKFDKIYEIVVMPTLVTPRDRIPFFFDDILLLLGGYNDEESNALFKRKLTKSCVARILLSYSYCISDPHGSNCHDTTNKFAGYSKFCTDIVFAKGWQRHIKDEHVRAIMSLDASSEYDLVGSSNSLVQNLINNIINEAKTDVSDDDNKEK